MYLPLQGAAPGPRVEEPPIYEALRCQWLAPPKAPSVPEGTVHEVIPPGFEEPGQNTSRLGGRENPSLAPASSHLSIASRGGA